MLKIYTLNNMPTDKKNEKVPWDEYFRNKKITKYFDESDAKIVRDVEETSLMNEETINGKFSGMPIGIGALSEGCKTLLCINHAIKTNTIKDYLFNITSCGGNAITYLADVMAKDTDVYAYVEHGDFGGSENTLIEIDGQRFSDTLEASEKLLEIQGEMEDEDNSY